MKIERSNIFGIIFLLLSLILFPINAMAGNSPFPAPEETDSSFVTDTAPKLDSYLFVDSSPIVFDIEIKRYVGDTESDGTLSDYQKLIDNKVISASATLRMPVYDVDDDYSGTYYVKEIDKVYFNGHYVGLLSGGNGNWKQNSFAIPIEWIKFPEKGSNGNSPTPAKNEVRINIDTGNGGQRVWAVEIDWAELFFDAMPPIILIHGNGSNGDFWNRMKFVKELESQGIPYDNSINLIAYEQDDDKLNDNYIKTNSKLLRTKIPEKVKEFGAKTIHIAAHSKGGLDTRDYLQRYYNTNQLKVVSFTTISTPHQGSAGADLIRDMKAMNWLLLDVRDLTSLENIVAGLLPYNNGTKNLTTSYCEKFNARNSPYLPSGVIYQSISADADLSGNGKMESSEYMEMIEEDETLTNIYNASVPITIAGFPISIPVGHAGVDIIMQTMYDFLGSVKSTKLDESTKILGITVLQRIQKEPTTSFQKNDLMVTQNSARSSKFTEIGMLKKNHASVAGEDAAELVIQKMKNLQ